MEDYEDKTERRLADETTEHLAAIRHCFDVMFGAQTEKKNTFTVKLDVINTARSYWLKDFTRIYDSSAFRNGDVIDGVCYLGINSDGVSLLSDNHLLLEDISFTEILQLSHER